MNQKYRGILNCAYGALSGLIGTLLLYPTYLFKRIMQANSKNISILLNFIIK
jgi:hypothetical protein